MQVKFVGGPLDGETRELPELDVVDGSVIQLPSEFSHDDPQLPGDETLISYLHEGDGMARYVGGIGPA